MKHKNNSRQAGRRILRSVRMVGWLVLASCFTDGLHAAESIEAGKIFIPFSSVEVRIDGKLDESCYRAAPAVENFVIACRPKDRSPPTKAWLFWQPERLVFAFHCEDADIVAAKPTKNEHDVDGQDRVELFFWSGRESDTYYSIEIAACNALHDYSARFYRRFDDAWSPPGLKHVARRTPKGYCVEGEIPREAIEKMGFRLEPDASWRLGLFRADFFSRDPKGEPTWITWIDAKDSEPDFHVAPSFGRCILGRDNSPSAKNELHSPDPDRTGRPRVLQDETAIEYDSTTGEPGVESNAIAQWRARRFGLFIHWGPSCGRGIAHSHARHSELNPSGKVPAEVYDQFYKEFNPTKFNPEMWIDAAWDAGMRYVIWLTKHHDGFSMFDSAATDYDVMATPCGKDVTAIMADACRQKGMSLGFYYSPKDWRHPDYNQPTHKDRYNPFYATQMRELASNYGKIDVLWFDGTAPAGVKHWGTTLADAGRMLRKEQPDMVCNDRGGFPSDFVNFECRSSGFDRQYPWETCDHTGCGWIYSVTMQPRDFRVLLRQLIYTIGRDGNYLLGFGLMPSGEAPPEQLTLLRQFAEWMKPNGEAVHGTRGGPYIDGAWGASTCKNKTIYLFLTDNSTPILRLPPIDAKILSIQALGGGRATFTQDSEGLSVSLPLEDRHPIASVLALKLDRDAFSIRPVDGQKNLAQACESTASSELDAEHAAAKAVDGDYATTWMPSKDDLSPILTVSFSKPTVISAVAITCPKGWCPFAHAIEVEVDGKWREVHHAVHPGNIPVLDFSPTTAERVRLVVRRSSAAQRVLLGELRVFGPPVLDANPDKFALSDTVTWLQKEAHRVIRASKREMKDGTTVFPPQAGGGYAAFYLRDYVYALEGSIDSFTNKELVDACRLFVRNLDKDGAGVHCLYFDGRANYRPGGGKIGANPVADGSQFTVSLAWHTYQKTKDKKLLAKIINALVKTMKAVPLNPDTHLVHIKPGAVWDRGSYGFTDSIRKEGDELFCSLLYVQASRQLADLFNVLRRAKDAHYWKAEAETVAASIRKVFWEPAVGLFLAATVTCRQPDIWGSAFAVYLGVADDVQSRAIAQYFKAHYKEIVFHGQIRHLPGGVYWERGCARDTYQNGAFWATPSGWFVYALDLVDSKLADQTVLDMADHFKEFGACEWIIATKRQLPNYLASAALPLDGIRAMMKRREASRLSQPGKSTSK